MGGLEAVVYLAKGAKVMLTMNLWTDVVVFPKHLKVVVALNRVGVTRPELPCPSTGVWGHAPPGNF